MHQEKNINRTYFNKNSIYANLALLLATFVLGLAVMIGVHLVLNHEINELDKQIHNENTRYRIGELLIAHINEIELDFYRMATTINPKSAQIISEHIQKNIETIKEILVVIEKGGELRHSIELNIVDKELVYENLKYYPSDSKKYTLEKIDLQPKLEDVRQNTELLYKYIYAKNEALENQNIDKLKASIEDIQSFLKKANPLFLRMKENSSRLLFDSKKELDKIKEEVEVKKDNYVKLELFIILVDLLLMLTIGWLSAKQIRGISKKLEDAKKSSEILALKAKRASEFKSEFLANMSHEIRTPLNAILGFIDILLEKTKDDESLNHLKTVHKSGKNLLGIINDILDISKIESGKLEIDIQDMSIKDELNDVASLFFEKAKEKNIHFNRSIDNNLPDAIKSDQLRLKQILSNLLSNAIKFTDENGTVSIKAEFNSEKNHIIVCVQDSGIGISKDHMKYLFSAFSQEDSSITRKYGGTGLGLAISYRLVEKLGGQLTVDSKKNEGSTFCFYIPYIEGDKTKLKSHTPAVKQQIKFNGKILVVEDVKANQQLMKVMLKSLGLESECANDGVEGVEMASKTRYSLIFMDENMPNLNGREAAKQIIEYYKTNNLEMVPIVALTANALKGDREKFIDAGMNDYLTKPINKNEIVRVLSQYLETKQ